jgi:putative alpha-1,2-mannosidase
MSAWYVFSALGFYPATPGDPQYLMGSPLFGKAVLTLPGNKTFTITAEHNGPQQPYIQSAELNGEKFDRTSISHQTIVNGGEMTVQMDAAPNYHWGASPLSRPVSPLENLVKSLGQ